MSQIEALSVDLKIEDRTVLFVMLSADGAVNRMGSGTITESATDLYIAQTDGRMFREVVAYVEESWLERPGNYLARQRKGKDCSLSIVFYCMEGGPVGLRYLYGHKSEGPPEDIRAFVLAAVDATQSFYEEQQRKAR